MLNRAPLEVVPPYLRTLWIGLASGGLKGQGGEVNGYIPRVGLPSDKLRLLFFIFLDNFGYILLTFEKIQNLFV